MRKKRNFRLFLYPFYFIIFSLIGSLMEYFFGFFGGRGIAYDKAIFELIKWKLYFIPYYGLGGIILIFVERFLEKKKVKFILWGVINGLVITFIELIGGISSLIVFGHKFWDYSGHAFNFLGIISFKMFLIWVVVGYSFSLIYRYIISFLNRFLL